MKYAVLIFLVSAGCRKDHIDPVNDRLIDRFIVNDQVYEYKYNNNRLTGIIYPSGEVCNFSYINDSLVNYTTRNYSGNTESGYYRFNKDGNVVFKCAYRKNDTLFTIFQYDEKQFLVKDSTWNRNYISYNRYGLIWQEKTVSYDKRNFNVRYITVLPETSQEGYENYIDWMHYGIQWYGVPAKNLPLSGTRMEESFSFPHKSLQSNVNYIYSFDSKNRITERKETFNNRSSNIIKIEYLNE